MQALPETEREINLLVPSAGDIFRAVLDAPEWVFDPPGGGSKPAVTSGTTTGSGVGVGPPLRLPAHCIQLLTWSVGWATHGRHFEMSPGGRVWQQLVGDTRWEYGLPPRGEPELAWLQHCLSKVTVGGMVTVMMPAAAASRRAGRQIRNNLLRAGALRAVMTPPPCANRRASGW